MINKIETSQLATQHFEDLCHPSGVQIYLKISYALNILMVWEEERNINLQSPVTASAIWPARAVAQSISPSSYTH